MQKNVGGYDRLARLVGGPLLVVVGLAGYAGLLTLAFGPFPQALTSPVVLLVGLALTVTGAVQKCPLNAVFGANTYRRRGGREAAETGTVEETRPGRSG